VDGDLQQPAAALAFSVAFPVAFTVAVAFSFAVAQLRLP